MAELEWNNNHIRLHEKFEHTGNKQIAFGDLDLDLIDHKIVKNKVSNFLPFFGGRSCQT